MGKKPSTDTGRIHSAPPIKIQRDPSKPLLGINPHHINKDTHALQGITPITDYKAQASLLPTPVPGMPLFYL